MGFTVTFDGDGAKPALVCDACLRDIDPLDREAGVLTGAQAIRTGMHPDASDVAILRIPPVPGDSVPGAAAVVLTGCSATCREALSGQIRRWAALPDYPLGELALAKYVAALRAALSGR